MSSRIATDSDRDTVVAILVDAFFDDPTWSWVFPTPTTRRAHQRWLWDLMVRGAMPHASVWLSDDDTATSVWIPPGASELTEEQEATLEPSLRRMLGEVGAARVLGALDGFDRAHPRGVPHWYLSLLGTSSEHRGRGYGLRLLEHNLGVVDASGLPAYLEASNVANVVLYERYGFAVAGAFALPDRGPEVITMWRPGLAAETA